MTGQEWRIVGEFCDWLAWGGGRHRGDEIRKVVWDKLYEAKRERPDDLLPELALRMAAALEGKPQEPLPPGMGL